jgi:hypothetical protein
MTKSETPDFHRIVQLLRELPAEYRVVALHASLFWNDEQVRTLVSGGQFGPSELKPKASPLQ